MRRTILALLAVALIAPAAAQVPTTLPANTVVGRLGIGSGPAQAIPFATLSAQLTGFTIPSGFAEMKPFPNQGSGAWNVTDPFGNAISTTGTTCQGFDKLVAAAATNGWSWRVVGVGNISCTAPIAFPTCFLKSELIDVGVTLTFTAQGSSTLVTANSHENCQLFLRGAIAQNGADTGVVLSLAPTTIDSAGNIVFAGSVIEIGSIAPAAGGIGVRIDPTSGSFIGNSTTIHDVNGGATGIQVLNPGSGFIAVEQNKFFLTYNHGQTTRVVQIGTSTTNAGNMRYNTWFPGRIDPGTGATVAWDTWARNDTIVGLAIDNETANATTGLKLESGANDNIFLGGVVQATTPLSDAGLGNQFLNVSGVANAGTFALLPACAAAFEGMTKGVTDSSTATWGATITGSSTNHVQAYCNGTNWTVGAK